MTDYIDVTNLMAQPIKSMGAITELCLELQKEIDRLQDIVEKQRSALEIVGTVIYEAGSLLDDPDVKMCRYSTKYLEDQTNYGKAIIQQALSLTATEKETKE